MPSQPETVCITQADIEEGLSILWPDEAIKFCRLALSTSFT